MNILNLYKTSHAAFDKTSILEWSGPLLIRFLFGFIFVITQVFNNARTTSRLSGNTCIPAM